MAKHVKHIEAWYKYFETFEHERNNETNNETNADDKEILMVYTSIDGLDGRAAVRVRDEDINKVRMMKGVFGVKRATEQEIKAMQVLCMPIYEI